MLAPWQYKVFGVSSFTGARPTNINIEITNRCCLRCQMCHAWKNTSNDELDIEQWNVALDLLFNWLGSFRLTITGGEPFIKVGIWDFLERCIRYSLPVVVITNGYSLGNNQLERLLKTRITQLVVSLDSLSADVHDQIRGVPGAFEKVWDVLRFLGKSKRSFLLGTSTVITDRNLLELGDMALRLMDVGVDRILFQPIQEGFGIKSNTNWPYRSLFWPSSAERLEQGIEGLLDAKAHGARIVNSIQEIIHFRDYFLQGKRWRRPWPCQVGFTTLHIDASGQVRMCVPHAHNIGSVRVLSPADIWMSEAADLERQRTLLCRRACLLSCNRTYSLQEKITFGMTWLRHNHWWL